MSKNITFTANSLNKPLSYKQFKTVTQLIHSRDIGVLFSESGDVLQDQNHVLHPATLDTAGNVVQNGAVSVLVSTILSFDMVPDENKPGQTRRNYKFLPNLNVVDASTLLDYLFKCPDKNSGNGMIQNGQAVPVNHGGFGGAV